MCVRVPGCTCVCLCVFLRASDVNRTWLRSPRVFVCTTKTLYKKQVTLPHTATHCNTLQHTATHCNTLQHTATHYNTLQHTATHVFLVCIVMCFLMCRLFSAVHVYVCDNDTACRHIEFLYVQDMHST